MLLHPCRPSDKHDPDNASAVLRLTATPSGHTERPHRAASPSGSASPALRRHAATPTGERALLARERICFHIPTLVMLVNPSLVFLTIITIIRAKTLFSTIGAEQDVRIAHD